MKAFGEACNPEFEHTPVPVGAICSLCETAIEAGDSGVWANNDTIPWHIECFVRSLVGSA